MATKENPTVIDQVKISSYFVVAALSPSFLVSLICVFLYLIAAFPEVKEPITDIITNLLAKAGVKTPTVNKTGEE